MDVVIIGQSWLAKEALRKIKAIDGVSVLAVASEVAGDRFEALALEAGIQVVAPGDVPKCDLLIAAHCLTYVAREVRSRARLGTLVYHPSLLPRHRGKGAVEKTTEAGDPVAGGTIFWADDGLDTGPVEAQDWCFVAPGDTPQDLWRRELGPMGVRLLSEAVARLASGCPPAAAPQEELYATG